MCGRYYIDIDEPELREIVREAEEKARESLGQITVKAGGEIFPTDIVPVRVGLHQIQPMKWGFVNYAGKPVINARSETALEKPMFQASMTDRRCLVPASGYFEWKKSEENKRKTKFRFYMPGGFLYFAACYRHEKNSPLPHFVILTRQAAGGAETIHDRMPVILQERHMDTWFSEGLDALGAGLTDLSYCIA